MNYGSPEYVIFASTAMALCFLLGQMVLWWDSRIARGVFAVAAIVAFVGGVRLYAQVQVPTDCYWWFGYWCCPTWICG
jgi:hypothetical protein